MGTSQETPVETAWGPATLQSVATGRGNVGLPQRPVEPSPSGMPHSPYPAVAWAGTHPGMPQGAMSSLLPEPAPAGTAWGTTVDTHFPMSSSPTGLRDSAIGLVTAPKAATSTGTDKSELGPVMWFSTRVIPSTALRQKAMTAAGQPNGQGAYSPVARSDVMPSTSPVDTDPATHPAAHRTPARPWPPDRSEGPATVRLSSAATELTGLPLSAASPLVRPTTESIAGSEATEMISPPGVLSVTSPLVRPTSRGGAL